MTLHVAIEKLLRQKGHPMTLQQIAMELNKNGWYVKKDGSKILAYQILGRTKTYSNIFIRERSFVWLLEEPIPVNFHYNSTIAGRIKKPGNIRADKDESYVLNICDKVLKLTSSRQHKFEFLVGDPGINGKSVRLPVDCYYHGLKLVIEYREKQHTENVNFFDKPERMTVSGVHRGEQRKIYDARRRQVLPEHDIMLIEISYSDFNHDDQKKIIRNEIFDENIVRQKLVNFVS